MNCIFNKLLQMFDGKMLVNGDTIALDGSNIWVLKTAKVNSLNRGLKLCWLIIDAQTRSYVAD
ncbi:hypothetical protein IV04_02180 [Serratia sp. Ag1]|nr:hypothetical protein JV45_00870 [Serratia sp. Ag2]KFL00270.1 hypothetical protein IV04_02180 [Serratia sp. Ag1]